MRPRYLKDMRGRVVKAPEYRPSGDQNPAGKAATRRRKQILKQQQKQLDAGFEKLDELLLTESNPQPSESWVQRQFVNELADNVVMSSPLMDEATQAAVAKELSRTGMVIVDDYGPIPREVWDATAERAKRRLDQDLEHAMAGGPIPVNVAPARPAAVKPRMGLGLTRGILAAALLVTMGTYKPKE